MILAVSRFRVANGREGDVTAAFLDRPGFVDHAPGFLGLEVFTPPEDPALFYLVTRWTDQSAFRTWHGSEDHRRSHRFIPKGLRLDPAATKVIVLDRLRDPSRGKQLAELAADSAPFLAHYLEESRSVHVIAALQDGTIIAANGATAAALTVPVETLIGRPLWSWLTEADSATLRRRVESGERHPRERFLLNLVDVSRVPHTLECRVDVQPDGFVVIGEPRPRDERLLEERLLQLNNELAVLAREHARQAKELEATNTRLARAQGEIQEALNRERQARGTAEAAVLVRDEFLSVAAHELRQPLASLRGYAQLLRRRLGGAETVDRERVLEFTQTVVEQSDRMGRLVEQLMNVARIEAGKFALDWQSLDLAELVREAVAASQATTDRHQLVLRTPAMLEVEGDPMRLGQVISNLLSNAVKYSPDGGDVDIDLVPPPPPSSRGVAERDMATLTVRDRGAGIPSERHERIFERFYQAHGEGHLGGLGLGLYIARQVVALHNGRVWVEAPQDGGTRFVVTLPTRRSSPDG